MLKFERFLFSDFLFGGGFGPPSYVESTITEPALGGTSLGEPTFDGSSFDGVSFGGSSFGGSSFGGMGGGFELMSTVFPILFVIVFIIIIGGIIYGITNHVKNSTAPQETSYARIVSKRMDVKHHTNHHHHNNVGTGHMSHSSRTYYYITLEFDNGTRKEFLDVKNLFGLVAEGDTGYAATQGEWIVAFERNIGGSSEQY